MISSRVKDFLINLSIAIVLAFFILVGFFYFKGRDFLSEILRKDKVVIKEGKFRGVEIPKSISLDNLSMHFREWEGKKTFALNGIVKGVDKKQRVISVEINADESSSEVIDISVAKDAAFYQWRSHDIRPEELEGDKFKLIEKNHFISFGGSQQGDLFISSGTILY